VRTYTAQQLVATLRWVKEHPNGSVYLGRACWPDETIPADQWRTWFRTCLNKKINTSLPQVGRKWSRDYQLRQWRDAQKVNNYAQHRIVYPVNRLETKELQARYQWTYTTLDSLSIVLTPRNE
jgi:hypothetical protein